MVKNDPRNWDEEKIWASILDPNFNFHPELNTDIFECWKNKFGISKKQYVEMNNAQIALEIKDWDKYSINTSASESIEYLEDILKRPNINPKRKNVAKILRDKLKIKTIEKRYGSTGCLIITDAIEKGDIDPQNYN